MKLKVLISLFMCSLILSCSNDNEDPINPESNNSSNAPSNTGNDVIQQEMTENEMKELENSNENTNTAPSSSNQSFTLKETSMNTIIGTIEATDAEQNSLTYRIQQTNTPFAINNNGNLRIVGTINQMSYNITVIISDGSLTSSINVVISISKMEGPKMLTTEQLKMIDFFEFSVFNETNDSRTTSNIIKWNSEVKVFLSGGFTNEDISFINTFFTQLKNISGNINIRLVNTINDSNVEIFFASAQDYINNRPNYIDGFTPTRGVVGFASFAFFNNLIRGAKIWVDRSTFNKNAIIKHEVLHALGFNHTEERQSIFYFAPSASTLSNNDIFTIKTLHNSLISPGLTKTQIEPTISNNIDSFFN